MPDLITYQGLARHYGIAMQTMYNRVHRGEAPVPVLSDTGKVIGWRPEEVERFDRAHQRTRYQHLYNK